MGKTSSAVATRKGRRSASGFRLPASGAPLRYAGGLRGTRHRAGRITLINLTAWDGGDLARLVEAGRRAHGPARNLLVVATASPIRSRGCALVGPQGSGFRAGPRTSDLGPRHHNARGKRQREQPDMVLAVAPPSRATMRRLVRLIRHEMAHRRGLEHREMEKDVLYSEGPVPLWGFGYRVRRRAGRAPSQIP